ncbi:uncharacterized protein LOC120725860 isoform X2 [Simochromis diagramma]|uniref:uncharacterized protein LOC120725860 isoform X2 n=1 Tax=Simochromis diagramma TaxID=43689 RepID=UPI001A7EF8D3|nr:uncharacterized protein LOC120725860 isoform X2 [Simochromis diagramma]
MCRSFLLIILTSCFCEMSANHNKDLYYQAEENSDITVEWTFTTKVSITISSLKIHCLQLPELKVFFNMDTSSDEPQHEQFAGRVQCDKDALTTGRVRLQLSRVRSNDSGRYLCRMATQFGKKVKEFRLNITAATVKPKPVTATREPNRKPERGERSLFSNLALGAGLAGCLAAFVIPIIYLFTLYRQGTT